MPVMSSSLLSNRDGRKVMNDNLKHTTVATFVCSFIILLNMDMSYLNTYFKYITKVTETRPNEEKIQQPRYTVALPDASSILNREVVLKEMSTYVHNTVVEPATVNVLPTSKDVVCRGSPSIRSP